MKLLLGQVPAADAIYNCSHNTVKSSLIEAGVLDGVNDNFPNTEMCMDYDPQLCYKTDNVSFVSKENIVGYNQSTPPSVLLLLLQPQLPPSSWEPTVVLPSLKANNIFDNAAGVKSSPISTYTDLVVPVCEESASISISGLCKVNSTCSNIIDGYELVSQRSVPGVRWIVLLLLLLSQFSYDQW